MSFKENDPVFKVTLSQCATCKNSKGLKCLIYGEKPEKYLDNIEKCPNKEEKK